MNESPSEHTRERESGTITMPQKNVWAIVHFALVAAFFIVFFWPAFYWAAHQLESGDEPWQLVLVPFLSFMMASKRVSEMRLATCRAPDGRSAALSASGFLSFGFPLMFAGALLNLFGVVLEHPMPSQVGMVIFIQGAAVFLWGWRVYRGLAFPLLYLFLAVPLPRTVLVAMTGSLKVFGAAVAEKMLSFMGSAVVREGAILKFPTFTLVVANECSGLQSLITLSVASLPVAYLMEARFWKKVLIVVLSLPLGLAANVVRLCVTAVLGQTLGEKVTHGWPHTLTGVTVVFAVFFALYGLSNALSGRGAEAEQSG